MNLRAQAQKRDRLLASIEALGAGVIRRYADSFQKRGVRALSGGGSVKISKADEEKIVAEMADLMMLAFVKRYRMERLEVGVDLQLSFSRDVAKLARNTDLDLDGIRQQMISIAKPKVRQSVGWIEERINDSLHAITAKQQPTAAATRELRRRFDEMGLTPRNPALAETLVRTHAQIAFSAASWQLDQDDPDDVIWGYTYVTVGDNRVRDEHADLHGVTRPKDDPFWSIWWPPNGWNCRCQPIPITEPAPLTKIPKGIKPDEGFSFSPKSLLGGTADKRSVAAVASKKKRA
jgi:SPP1 gp7 family putative phage head morphogenesis protein